MLVAGEAAADVVVEVARQVLRRALGGQVDDEEVGRACTTGPARLRVPRKATLRPSGLGEGAEIPPLIAATDSIGPPSTGTA